MSSTPPLAQPRRAVDEHGRALPMTEEEARRRAEEVARGLDALDAMGDEAEQAETLERLVAALDEDRAGARKLL